MPNSLSRHPRLAALALVTPALAMVALFFLLPLLASVVGAFETPEGPGLANFSKAFALYSRDMLFTLAIIGGATLLTGLGAVAIAGYLTLGECPLAVAALRWLYRWPLFIPFIVVGQIARSFLAKNGLMNNALIGAGLLDPLSATGMLDWRGLILAFAWKQIPFVALLVAGAMASLDRGGIEAARNLGASRPRILWEILLPQVAPSLLTALILSFVTMMSVLSVPLMVASQSPTLLTVDIAFRINAYRDYGLANALGMISLAISATVAWFYLRHSLREKR
ncbi:MAG: ABC transporter permease [Candidatus Dactylopiibacterium carminicum]|uniref:ABC transporter permease n=1 Tax=Candidatus Dactylopiibacterium carminicum TaxID=857335 RepID=A0A272ETI7_9RHOO|nr:ABC transporter permease subunit [Candidatus Dactylopiibacterium carminicum]KAF7599387.1 ABC transporter permease [Candidatus Dactylopiibacterium carminicum]PAS93397.1 MAG: ABC transporter permease [Candidatus Dactylopiibacterium carminicum]PAS98358.1 MAG: ABC transporter permease [Candidatus Dactylopiibacterium carminicum]PAS99396.1 MAG: ABC transporter permease [Candidatus Dactylopiibacterium carminicum]